MVNIAGRQYLGAPPQVVELEGAVWSVLSRHYFVRGQTLTQVSSTDMLRHQLAHLAKALRKLHRAIDNPSEESISILRDELAPDMVIYALECAWAFESAWWRAFPVGEFADGEYLGRLAEANGLVTADMDLGTSLRIVESVMIRAMAAVGELCDRTDHRQESLTRRDEEIVTPFMQVALALATCLGINLSTRVGDRLVDVANRYVGQPVTGSGPLVLDHRVVAIASSSRFYGDVRRLAEDLARAGISVFTPSLESDETKVDIGEAEKVELTHAFIRKIDHAKVLYVVDGGGYTGTSVCLEIGYAFARGKVILASEQPSEFAIRALVTSIVNVGHVVDWIRQQCLSEAG